MKHHWFKRTVAVLGVIWFVLFALSLISLLGIRSYVQGDTAKGRQLLRITAPASWLLSRMTFRAVPPLEMWHLLHILLLSDDRYLVLLQNTDEIRATGGFIGSYTVLDFGSDEPLHLEIRDMYDPIGVSMTLPSPAGQAEYLSEGNGMKLIDANWNPDFPSSARTILQYFENIQGDPQRYDGVIAITLPTIEQLIETLGGIYLADEQQTVTAETAAAVLREDRDQFFAGSKDKEQSLQSFYTALKLRIIQLTWDEWRQVFAALKDNVALEVQLFSHQQKMQSVIETAGLDGALLPYGANEIYIFPVESNVGINKANRKVMRALNAVLENQLLTVRTHFYTRYTPAERLQLSEGEDYSVAPHLAYVNYYRLFVRSDMEVKSIAIHDQPVTQWDEEIITAANGLSYKQIGFLVVVPEETRVTTQVQFIVPKTEKPQFIIQPQVGVDYTSVLTGIYGDY